MKIYINQLEVDTLELETKDGQLGLEKLYHSNNKPDIRCGCNDKTQLHIKHYKKSNLFLISTNPNRASEHESWCELSLNLLVKQMRGIHYRAIEEITTNKLSIHTKHLPIFLSDESNHSNCSIIKKRGYKYLSNSGISVGSLGRELLSRAWEYAVDDYSLGSKFYPSLRVLQIALKKLFINPKLLHVKITKERQLTEVLWIGQSRPQSFYFYNKERIRPFILVPLIKDGVKHLEGDLGHIKLVVNGLNKDETFELKIAIDDWEEAVAQCPVNYKSHEHFYIVGVGEAGEYGSLPKIHALELIPVTARGMFVNSSYEKSLFELFEKEKRLYKRSNQRIMGFNGYLPNALLIDTEKPCIVEVFDKSVTNKDYHAAKDQKMQYYRTLNNYMTLYWHAYRNPKLPALPIKKTPTN